MDERKTGSLWQCEAGLAVEFADAPSERFDPERTLATRQGVPHGLFGIIRVARRVTTGHGVTAFDPKRKRTGETMKREPNWLGAFTVATLYVGALAGWQFNKYSHGYGLFYSISPRYGWAALLLIAVAMYFFIFRAVLRDKDF